MADDKKNVYCTYQAAPEHQFQGHPESPGRMKWMKDWQASPPYPEIRWLGYSPASAAEVSLVHRPALMSALEAECTLGPHEFEPAPSYVTEKSYSAALGAAGATLAVSRKIIADGEGLGFAIVRPPGHHAEPDHAMGFCLLNNVAIAAADAVASGLKKVAIFDLDAHHGNGTEAIFWDSPEAAYCSIHESGIYPGTGAVESAPHARGRIVDVPVPPFSGNTTFRRVMDEVVKPWLAAFRPEMLFVSAGFDAHFSDPLTTLGVDTSGFNGLTKNLMALSEKYCRNRMVFVLEGGYDPVALRDNIEAVLAAFSGRMDFHDHFGKGPDVHVEVDALIEKVRQLHHF
jgi:acetoin utilization deacetylase AcuC-like enzyme